MVRYDKCFDRWSQVLVKVAMVCVILLIISQILLLKDGPRRLLSRVDQMEGESISFQMPRYAAMPLNVQDKTVVTNPIKSLREGKSLVIRMIKPEQHSGIFVTINGEKSGDFGRGDVKVTVYDGDYVEIDTTGLADRARFVVNVPSGGLSWPLDGLVIEGSGTNLTIGKIKFKS